MDYNWQDGMALLVVGAAVLYLLRVARTVFSGKKGTACGGCPKCVSGNGREEGGDGRLVVLDVARVGTKVEGP